MVEQIARDLDEADDHVGGDRRVRMLDSFFEGGIICVRDAIELAKTLRVAMSSGPFFDFAGAHEVAIIFKQFFLTCAGNVRELYFRFLRGVRGHAAFENVLLS